MRLATVLIIIFVAGCRTVHTPREDSVPIAVWIDGELVPLDGEPERPVIRDLIVRVMREHGLNASVDEAGISVPEDEETRAREVLLTDRRLAESGLIVLLAIPAGTGIKTAAGFEVPAVAPAHPMRLPTTRSATP